MYMYIYLPIDCQAAGLTHKETVRVGVDPAHTSKRRAALESWLDTDLARRFAGRVLPVSRNVRDFGASGLTTMNPWEDDKR